MVNVPIKLPRLRTGVQAPAQQKSWHGIEPGGPPYITTAETPVSYSICIDATGYQRDDIRVGIHNRLLVIEAAQSQPAGGLSVSFRRTFSIPADGDGAGTRARFREGVLQIWIPRWLAASTVRLPVLS